MEKTITFFPDFYESIEFLPDELFGAAIRAAIKYQLTGEEYSGDNPSVKMAFNFAKGQTDRKREYSKKKSDAANCKWRKIDDSSLQSSENVCNSDEMQCEGMQNDAQGCTSVQSDAEGCTEVQDDAPNPYPSPYPYNIYSPAAAAEKEPEKSFGKYGWVKLTDGQYSALVNDLGREELERCIAYVDKSAQKTGNKNKWRDWDLVLRDCSREKWGLKRGARHGPEKKGDIHGCTGLGQAELEAIANVLKQPPDDFGLEAKEAV